MSKTKDTIEGLKKKLATVKDFKDKGLEGVDEDIAILSHAIQIAQAQEQAEGMLPEKKNEEFAEKDLEKAQLPNVIKLLAGQVGFNEMHDIATPILAKKILECEKLEKELQERCNYCPIISQEKELQSLKSKLTVDKFEKIMISKLTRVPLAIAEEVAIKVKVIAQALIKELGVK